MNARKLWNPRLKSMPADIPTTERGQVIYMVVMMMLTMLGATAMVVDVGRTFIQYHQLVAATDAAALAGAEVMASAGGTAAQTTAAATSYSSATGNHNTFTDLSTVTTNVSLVCLTSSVANGTPCYGAGSYNAVKVVQTETMPTYFANAVGTGGVTLSATATALMNGSQAGPYNIAIILDATLSQDSTDDDCGVGITEMNCELQGVQAFLSELLPCGKTDVTCSFSNGVASDSVDRVALFAFPAMSVGTNPINSNCTTPISSAAATAYGPTYTAAFRTYSNSATYGYYTLEPNLAWPGIVTDVPYSFPAVGATSYSPGTSATSTTYQVTPWESDYRTSPTASTLNTNSQIVQALGGVSGCNGLLPGNYDGNIGTYYAGVLYAAQASLVAEQAANPGSKNAIILLSDGNATAPQSNNAGGTTVVGMPSPAGNSGTYPSYKNECGQAVTAGQYATGQGTKVFTIAYGSPSSGCTTDSSRPTPCATMKSIASSAGYFYSDYQQTGNTNTACVGTASSVTSLTDIFKDIYPKLGNARLVPNNSQ
jgi:hypothetical protein